MNKTKYDNIIAIDPDTSKSGVASLKRETKQLELSSLSFPELLDYLMFARNKASESNESLLIVVEAGYLIKSNWHLTKYDSKQTAAAKGNSTGRNHETARKIVEMCLYYDLTTLEQRPLIKCWKGADRKITHEELVSFTGIKGRTNQEERDAALIAWIHAGFTISIKSNLKYTI